MSLQPFHEGNLKSSRFMLTLRTLFSNPRSWRKEPQIRAETDARYHRVDFSSKQAHEARLAFVKNISRGEAHADLALAALQICSEDDALISNSPVPFPVKSYIDRMKGISRNIANRITVYNDLEPEDAIGIIEETLFNSLSLRHPSWGSSNLPERSIVDHPGVWEDQRYGYLHELLITRCGIPSLLTILYQHILRTLLSDGIINFAASFDYQNSSNLPKARSIPGLSRESVTTSDGTLLNTCSMDCLFDVLYFLKRAFWPFSWDTNFARHGGFKQGCANVLFGGMTAEIEAASRSAQHRLSRGIWTTTGGGDVHRALSACERLVLLNGTENHLDRRDLGLLYFSLGRFSEACAELGLFEKSNAFADQDFQDKKQVQLLIEQSKRLNCTNSEWTQSLSVDTFLRRECPGVEVLESTTLTW